MEQSRTCLSLLETYLREAIPNRDTGTGELYLLDDDRHLIRGLAKSLRNALDGLQPSAVEQVGAHWRDLTRVLHQSADAGSLFRDVPLAIAILRVLATVSRPNLVSEIRQTVLFCATADTPGVLTRAATAAIQSIEAGIAAERDRQTLLRPADAPEANTLLRPAAFVVEEESGELLRPLESPENARS